MTKTFQTTLEAGDRGKVIYIRVPFDVKKAFGKARPPVVITVKKHSWRSTVAVYGGEYFLPLRETNRAAADVDAGDRVKVTMKSDTAPRVVKAPAALAAALKKNGRAKAAWEKLSFSHQREHAEAITGAKKPETRARRVEKTIAMLLG